MKNLFKEAHKLTREIVKKYNDVDYKFQFSLCLSYLQEKEKENREIMKEMKEMSVQELENIVNLAKCELESRKETKIKIKVLYTHDCQDCANYHLGKYKHWAKVITAVDISKTNGFAFAGDFLEVRKEHMLDIGTLVVEICDTKAKLYRIIGTGKEILSEGNTKTLHSFIVECKKFLEDK